MEEKKTNLLRNIDRAQAAISSAREKIEMIEDRECIEALVVAQSKLDQARAAVEQDMDLDHAEQQIEQTIQEMIALLSRLGDLKDGADPER